MDEAQAPAEPVDAAPAPEVALPPPQYMVSLALQRGPYPYEQRTIVVAAADDATVAEDHPEEWKKAMKRAVKEGGEVRVVRIGLDAGRVAALFEGAPDPPSSFPSTSYLVRLALCDDQPPVVVAAVDQEMAQSMGIDVSAPLPFMPMFYRRQVARALGELREVLVSVPWAAVDEAFVPKPVPAVVERLLGGHDPRF